MQSISNGVIFELRRLISSELDAAIAVRCERNPELRRILNESQTWQANRPAYEASKTNRPIKRRRTNQFGNSTNYRSQEQITPPGQKQLNRRK